MKKTTTIATLMASVALSTGIGFGISQASQPEPAAAAASKAELRLLDNIDDRLRSIDESIGSSTLDQFSVLAMLNDIAQSTERTCDAVGGTVC